MKPIPLPVAELKSALSGIGKVIPQRSTLPILQHVKVERTHDGWTALTGTDLDRFVTMRLEHPTEGPPCSVLVPFDQLQQLTKNCGRDERLLIDLTEHGPVIKFALADNLGESKVKPMPVGEFPETPRLRSEPIPMPPTLRTTIHEAMTCTSTDSTRYVLNGTFIDASNPKGFYVVGTDGKHLYSANSFTLPVKNSLLIPNHKFLGWKEFNNDGEWQMKADNQHVQFSTRRWRFISKQIDGTYPNWRQTVPNPADAKTVITLDPAQLDTLIKLIQRMPCHDDRYHSLGLEWKAGQFLLLGKDSASEPWLRVPVPDVKATGPEITIFVNRKLLIKALQFGLNTISLIDPVTPMRFHSQGKQMIVMPLRLECAPTPPPPNQQPAPVRAIPAPAVAPPQPPKPMITHPTSEEPPANGSPSPLEEALDLTLQIRDKFTDGFNLLRDLSTKLKAVHRDHKISSREFNSVRSTLRSLQGLKL
jgi:DNA polymerase III sliding clamp (beta) subunit (PCNA family)